MNIYVVSKLWREHGTLGNGMVIGAGVGLEDAQAVADRWDCRPGKWGTWVADPGPGARSQRWTREVIGRDGEPFDQNAQEIVCLPLAGYIGDWTPVEPIDETGPALLRGLPALMTTARIAELGNERERKQAEEAARILAWKPPAGQATVTYPWADDENVRRLLAAPDLVRDRIAKINDAIRKMREVIETVSSAKASFREMHGEWPDRIRVGSGAAWDYFERAADAIGLTADPTSKSIGSVLGIPVVLDPEMLPDRFRIGDWVFVIGTAANGIAEGSMVGINGSGLYESLRPRNPFPPTDGVRYRGFTSPPG